MVAPSRIRRARPVDAVALAEIERRCFSDPWSAQGFREILETPGAFGLVSERGGVIVGYLLGREIVGEGEILNLAVDRPGRRKGWGGSLLRAGLAYFLERGVEQVFLEVRESNEAARRLYLSHGFRPVGHRPDYYRNPPEGALIFRLALGGVA
jgi:ribosomal-protein-alanine N-acetyltransferase